MKETGVQEKFYCPPDQRDAVNAFFKSIGMNKSEGYRRLQAFLLGLPEPARDLILRQPAMEAVQRIAQDDQRKSGRRWQENATVHVTRARSSPGTVAQRGMTILRDE